MTLVEPVQVTPQGELLSVRDAQTKILEPLRVLSAETVSLIHAHGRVCAERVLAKLDHPPGPVSAMDGYACRSDDVRTLPARLQIAGISRAGEEFDGVLTEGACVRVFTGATVPKGADIIALQEDVNVQGREAEVLEVPKPGQFIRRAGLDFTRGQICAEEGRVLTARDVGLLTAAGHVQVGVRRWPRIAILSTGDELVAPGHEPGRNQIVASNGLALAAAVTGWGGLPVDLGIAADRIEAVAEAIERARGADMLVTTGGASVGDHDLVQASLLRLGFTCSFWRIAMRPGKPLMFGLLDKTPRSNDAGKSRIRTYLCAPVLATGNAGDAGALAGSADVRKSPAGRADAGKRPARGLRSRHTGNRWPRPGGSPLSGPGQLDADDTREGRCAHTARESRATGHRRRRG